MVRVVLGDITELEVDVIVNAANSHLMVGGGVDHAIHAAAGPGLKNELDSLAKYLEPGGVLLTSAYRLPAKYVIHTVAPIWSGGNDYEYEVLFTCYAESIALALKKGLHSIAFPALGTGAFGVPVEVSAEAAVRAIAEFEIDSDDEFEVILCCYSEADFDTYSSTIQRLIDEAKLEQEKETRREPELPDCPMCFWPLKRIVYGMIAPSDDDDFIVGGCSIGPDAPQVGCKNCGWEGHPGIEKGKQMIFAVLDEKVRHFAGGSIYESVNPHSFLVLIPGGPEYARWDLEQMKELWGKAENPSYWLAPKEQLIHENFGKLLLEKYTEITPEVMKFIGFRQIAELPKFEGN